ncbi:hypothetical protein NMG60_11006398 [Bertholletia excelsa]
MERCSGVFRRHLSPTEKKSGYVDYGEGPTECHACNQSCAPAFHSTSCSPNHSPQWEAFAGSSLIPIKNRSDRKADSNRSTRKCWWFGPILDPRSDRVQKWNRMILLARVVALAIDPLFLFAISVGRCERPCIYENGGFAEIVAVLRTCVDAVHLCHMWFQLRLAYVSRESMVVGCGRLVWDARAVAAHYLRSLKGFWLDAFVVLPLPQVVYLMVVPKLIIEGRVELLMTSLPLIFLLQFVPKICHSFFLMRRMRKVTGYIFGSVWWGFALNLIAYFLAAHAAGGYWYIRTVQRIALCLSRHCERTTKSCPLPLSCSKVMCHRGNSTDTVKMSVCLDGDGPFPFGIYGDALPIFSGSSVPEKILYTNLWAFFMISTMGNNLEPTTDCSEVILCLFLVFGGLVLFTTLILNIQVFMHVITVRKIRMQLRRRDLQWWMGRRQLPSQLRNRVHRFEQHCWATIGGPGEEVELLKDLPEGLRRDIKRHLCLDLIKKVPLFRILDDLSLDSICDRVKPLVFSKGEKMMREADPVQQMLFIARGRIKKSQRLRKGTVSTTMLGPGSFVGDELLSIFFHRKVNFLDPLPPATATFTCVESGEAFALDANDLLFIVFHFRHRLDCDKLKLMARYYSPSWRTWAAITVQLAWRRHVERTRGQVLERGGGDQRRWLRRFAAVLASPKPNDHLD